MLRGVSPPLLFETHLAFVGNESLKLAKFHQLRNVRNSKLSIPRTPSFFITISLLETTDNDPFFHLANFPLWRACIYASPLDKASACLPKASTFESDSPSIYQRGERETLFSVKKVSATSPQENLIRFSHR